VPTPKKRATTGGKKRATTGGLPLQNITIEIGLLSIIYYRNYKASGSGDFKPHYHHPTYLLPISHY
jgi:hypothetical protein